MARRAGSADLPLHGGRAPSWLADRMTRLGAVMSEGVSRSLTPCACASSSSPRASSK